jgi:hypothetical protein
MDGAFIKPNTIRPGRSSPWLVFAIHAHGTSDTVMLSLIKPLEGVGWRMKEWFCKRNGLLAPGPDYF